MTSFSGRSHRRLCQLGVVCFIFLVAPVVPGAAQEVTGEQLPNQQSSGSISGTVVDQSGAIVVSGAVRLTRGDQSPSEETLTEDLGQFSFPAHNFVYRSHHASNLGSSASRGGVCPVIHQSGSLNKCSSSNGGAESQARERSSQTIFQELRYSYLVPTNAFSLAYASRYSYSARNISASIFACADSASGLSGR